MKKKIIAVVGMTIFSAGLLTYGKISKYKIAITGEKGHKKMVVEYAKDGYDVRTVVGEGFRSTKVISPDKKTFELFMSEHSKKYYINKVSILPILADIENYYKDNSLGNYENCD